MDKIKEKIASLDKKQKNIIVAVIGILIFVAVYFLGVQTISTENDEIANKITERSALLQELKGYNDNIDIYKSGINDSKEDIDKNLSRLPVDVAEEDFLIYTIDLNDAIDTDFTVFQVQEPVEIGQFACMINDENKTVTGYSVSSSTSGTMTYEQMKEYLKYVYNESDEITYVNQISMTYDANTAKLSTVVELSKLYITYDGCTYIPVKIPDFAQGRPDLFGADGIVPVEETSEEG